MERLHKWLRAHLGFSRTERNAFLIMIPMVLMGLFSRPLIAAFRSGQSTDHSSDVRMLDSLLLVMNSNSVRVTDPIEAAHPVVQELFRFDPNTIGQDQLVKLGLPYAVAERVVKYRDKGGEFQIKRDFARIYGLSESLYTQLLPYIDLPESRPSPQEMTKTEAFVVPQTVDRSPIDINLADSVLLMELRGIGPTLSRRIIRFREALGGYVSTDQLAEVYGLDSLVVRELMERCFVQEGFEAKKLNINSATEPELRSHPYLTTAAAKAIVAYRQQHGMFVSLEDIRKIKVIDEGVFNKIGPYLVVDSQTQ